MRNRLRSIWREICFRVRLHPSYEELLAFRDAELDEFKSQWITAHLDRCARCQVERGRVEEDIRRFHSADPWLNVVGAPPLNEGLAHLRLAMQNCETAQFSASGLAGAVAYGDKYIGQQVAAELGLYLGPRAAATLLQGTETGYRDWQKLVRAAEPVLKDFCGQAAASAVTTRISLVWSRYLPASRTRLDLQV